MLYKIYTLTDPLTYQVRYIGLTKETLASRRSKHLTDARSGKHNHRVHWIRSLLEKGLKPLIEELDTAESYEALTRLEIYWISQFKSWGFALVNATDGGEGSVGYKHSKETLQKMHKIADLRKKPKKKKMSKGQQYCLLAESLSVSILQYDLQGNLMKCWKSRLEAAKSNNTSSSAIGHALKDPTRTAARTFWRYKSNSLPPVKIVTSLRKGNKLKLKIESSTGEIMLFDNSLLAQKALGISYPTLLKYMNNGKVCKNKYLIKKNIDETIPRHLYR